MMQAELSGLLDRWQGGDRAALDEMLPTIYGELKDLARVYLSREQAGHTLQPTALVHEAYMKLVEQRQVDWRNRAQFLGVAARVMRRVLLHHAETRDAKKRPQSDDRITLDAAINAIESSASAPVDLIDLNRALEQLTQLDARQSEVVELRIFGGLTIEETAEVLTLSEATVKREWNIARLWLRRELDGATA